MKKVVLAALATVPLLSSPLLAQPSFVGGELRANSYTTNIQKTPVVGVADAGEFVVVWASDGQDGSAEGIFGRRFNRVGSPVGGTDFAINTFTTNAQEFPAIAVTGTGDFVVVWSSFAQDGSGYGVFARRYASNGGAKDMVEFQVNTYTTGFQAVPDVAVDDSGGFVVVWDGYDQDGSLDGIFARRYDSAGNALDMVELQVNTYTTGAQITPRVAVNGSGDFVVSWTSLGQDGDAGGVFARRFDSAGNALDMTEFQVNAYTTGGQRRPSVAMDEAGGFVVAWSGDAQDGSGYGVFARRYDGDGGPLDMAEFQVNSYTTDDQYRPAVGMDPAGAFVVVWESYGQDGSLDGVFARRFTASGTSVDMGEFQVNTYTASDQKHAAVGLDARGYSLAVWESLQDGSATGIFGQRFSCVDGDFDGVCEAEDVTVTSPQGGGTVDCSDPLTTRPAIAWSPGRNDKFRVYLSSSSGFTRGTFVTSGDTLLRTTSWTPSTKKWRAACNKVKAVNPTTPVMYIRVLGKDVDLPKDDPSRLTYSQTVAADVIP